MRLRHVLARVGPRWRLAAAAACLLLAVVSAIEGRASPPHRSGHVVVVAAHDLPAGRTLSGADLAAVNRRDAWPGAVGSSRTLVGRRLAGVVRRGEPVSAQRLLSPSLTRGLAAGVVALPVDVATDVRGLAEPGSRVDLLAVAADQAGTSADTPAGGTAGGTASGVTGDRAQRVGDGLLVLATLPPEASTESGCRLVLAVPRETAVKVAGLRAGRLFQVVVLPP